MAKSSATDHLANVPLFRACSKKDLAKIAKAGTVIDVPDGHVLTTQDTSSREAFVLLEGDAIVKRNDRKVAELGPGAVIGELGLLDQGPRTATVVTKGPAQVMALAPRDFAGILDEVPALSRKLLKSLAAEIRELDRKYFG